MGLERLTPCRAARRPAPWLLTGLAPSILIAAVASPLRGKDRCGTMTPEPRAGASPSGAHGLPANSLGSSVAPERVRRAGRSPCARTDRRARFAHERARTRDLT